MQASQWTTDIIVITAVLALACALLGYFAAALRQAGNSVCWRPSLSRPSRLKQLHWQAAQR